MELCAVDSARPVLLGLRGCWLEIRLRLSGSTDVGPDSRTGSQPRTGFHSRSLETNSLYPSCHRRCNRTGARFSCNPCRTSFRYLPSSSVGILYLQATAV